jgi:hypothetical protein
MAKRKTTKATTEKQKSGRKRIYDAEVIAKQLDSYIENSEDPMIEEFCLINKMSKDTIYRLDKECDALAYAIKKCSIKQEIRTVRKAESGEINTTFAIFKLKQKRFGWTDKQEIETSGETTVNNRVDLTAISTEDLKKMLGDAGD